MNEEQKKLLLLGKLLGEMYRIQRHSKMPCGASEGRIYALINGFEYVIEEELEEIGFVSKSKFDHVNNVLTPYWKDPKKLEDFKGFYDIENELEQGGVDRSLAIKILTYFKAAHKFLDVIAKMDSSNSPSECRTFDINEWDK